jgi:2-C-methyl-D-erythritol 4-phosphate cytidylyltransferase
MHPVQYAVIVAGGSGLRMNAQLPKQFMLLNKLPILMHTIQAFRNYQADISILLVLPTQQIATWHALCQKHEFNTQQLQLIPGGATRFQSCKAGIMAIAATSGLVAIHDGVRPFVAKATLAAGFALAAKKGSAVAVIDSHNSVRYTAVDGTNTALDRQKVQLVQTPQIFKLDWLQQAYSQPEQDVFTDDATVIEQAGYPIHLFEGHINNIKITTPADLSLAHYILSEMDM